jgi:hypothetical protein
VNPYVRVVLVVYAIFSAWQVYWLIEAAVHVEAIIPAIQSVWHWIAAWSIVGAASAVGAVTGRDLPARLAFGSMAVASVCGAATIWLSGWPMREQFYPFGEAIVLAAASLVMLLSPLRPVPSTRHLIDFEALLDSCDPGIDPVSGARERHPTSATP